MNFVKIYQTKKKSLLHIQISFKFDQITTIFVSHYENSKRFS